jgi:O-antigen/teichoic acid export membrane protein
MERNTLANLTGTIWSVLLGILCVPFFIRILGPEGFGLTGVLLALQGSFVILDLGIAATLNRHLARLSASGAAAAEQRDLVFTFQAIYWAAALLAGVTITALAPFIAGHWVQPHALSVAAVTACVRMMGISIALQFPFVFYQSGMLGLQRHVLFNALSVGVSTLRGPGTLLLLFATTRSVETYFGAQIVVNAIATCAAAVLLWRCLPAANEHVCRFRKALVKSEWQFGASYTANALANLALLQGDKLILSGVLPLAAFGYYTLAQRLATGLYALIVAVDAATFPQFSAATAANDDAVVARVYHRAAQVMAVLVAPAAVVIAIFSREVLMLWTRSAAAVTNAHLVLTLLAAGMLLHALAQASIFLQIAHARWRLIGISNAVFVLTILPSYALMGARFGGAGAAAVWVVLNAGYVATVPLMHRRLIRGELRQWAISDVCLPVGAAFATAAIAHSLLPLHLGALGLLAYVAATSIATTLACAATSAQLRQAIRLLHLAGATFAAAMRLVPRRWRFGVTLLLARVAEPFMRATRAYRLLRQGNVDGAAEITLFFLTNALTSGGTEFDARVRIEGYEAFVALCREGRGVLLVQPHAVLTHLQFRVFHDDGLEPIGVNTDALMRIAGTTIPAKPLVPSPLFLVAARNRLREGRLVCSMIDRAESQPGRTYEFDTACGAAFIAPALFEVAERCGARVAFTEVHIERGEVVGTIVVPASDTAAGQTREFADFMRAHVARRAEGRPGALAVPAAQGAEP